MVSSFVSLFIYLLVCLLFVARFFGVRWLLVVGCCLLFVVCWLPFFVRGCITFFACLFVGCCSCSLCVVCCLLVVVYWLFVVECCLVFVRVFLSLFFCLLGCCLLLACLYCFVACCLLIAVCRV